MTPPKYVFAPDPPVAELTETTQNIVTRVAEVKKSRG
jgi:hypothetical protein